MGDGGETSSGGYPSCFQQTNCGHQETTSLKPTMPCLRVEPSLGVKTFWGGRIRSSHKFIRRKFLGGGLKYFVFSSPPGEVIQFDEHIFQMG